MNWWFIQLAPRERRVLLIGTLALGGMLGYFILWQPFVTAYTQLENQVSVQQTTLLWMQETAQEIDKWRGPSRPLPVPTNQPALLSLIEKSINAKILSKTSKRIEPKGEQEVQVEFEEVSFTELMRCLGELYNQQQVQVSTISLERQSLPDKVRARITLFRFQNNEK
jgi:general secretion pathway protein M